EILVLCRHSDEAGVGIDPVWRSTVTLLRDEPGVERLVSLLHLEKRLANRDATALRYDAAGLAGELVGGRVRHVLVQFAVPDDVAVSAEYVGLRDRCNRL